MHKSNQVHFALNICQNRLAAEAFPADPDWESHMASDSLRFKGWDAVAPWGQDRKGMGGKEFDPRPFFETLC